MLRRKSFNLLWEDYKPKSSNFWRKSEKLIFILEFKAGNERFHKSEASFPFIWDQTQFKIHLKSWKRSSKKLVYVGNKEDKSNIESKKRLRSA